MIFLSAAVLNYVPKIPAPANVHWCVKRVVVVVVVMAPCLLGRDQPEVPSR
jgi:hypothetical protein